MSVPPLSNAFSRLRGRVDLLLVAVLALGLALRLLGITRDLPFSFYGDEAHFVKRAVSFGSGDLNPHWFHKPAGYMYLLFGEYGAMFVVGLLLGVFSGLGDFIALFVNDRTAFYLAGRLTSVAFGIGTVYLTYRIGRMLFGRAAGLLGALLLAVSLPHVLSSQYVKADVPASFFALACLFLLVRAVERGHPFRDYVLAGAAAGLCMGFKYYAPPLVPLFWVARLRPPFTPAALGRWLADARAWTAVGMLVVLFFAVSPFDFIDPQGFVRHTVAEKVARFTQPEAAYDPDTGVAYTTGIAAVPQALGQFLQALSAKTAMGKTATLLAFLGLVWLGVVRGGVAARMLALYVVLFALVAAAAAPFHVQWRHLTPIYPVLYLFEAAVAVRAVRALLGRVTVPAWAAFGAVAVLLAGPAFAATVQKGIHNARTDTRVLATRWIEAHIPADSKVLLDEEGPVLKANRATLEGAVKVAREIGEGPFTTHVDTYYQYQLEYQRGVAYDLTVIAHFWWMKESPGSGARRELTEKAMDKGNPVKMRGVDRLDDYLARGVRYVVLNAGTRDAYFTTNRATRFPEFLRFYQDVEARGTLIATFDPADGDRPGPTVWVYEFPPPGALADTS
jgi:4-amino-4-deoxy-L-arabinose transferase-like glycosyltransferase